MEIAKRARAAARAMAPVTTAQKDRALHAIAHTLRKRRTEVLRANAEDLAAARANGTRGALLDRLMLDEGRIEAMAESVETVASLVDPVGEILSDVTRPSGVRVLRRRVPLGVVAMIYEARPNVTIEASALTLKAGNAVILRGGSEARHSNTVLTSIVRESLADAGLPVDAVSTLPTVDRAAILELVRQTGTVDLVIPRGGEALIRLVTENARVPVMQHYRGVCHLYVDAGADLGMAVRLVIDGKLSRPSACNSLECLLIHREAAAEILPLVAEALAAGRCEMRADAQARAFIPAALGATAATDDDWGREFLDRVIAIKVVADLDEALGHVARHGSGHTEAICTARDAHAARWRTEVDAACTVVNASTRFHDGGELGLGAEIGIATSRLHWRGPMGLESLTSMKWQVEGHGETRH